LDVDRWKAIGKMGVERESSPQEMIREWIDLGMPLTAVSEGKQPAAVGGEEAAGKWLATVKLLEEEVTGLRDQLKLAKLKKQPAAGVSSEREEQLVGERDKAVGDWHEARTKLEKAEANLLLVMTTSDRQLEKIGRLEAKIVELTKGVVQPVAVTPGKVSDFDQTPEADESRKKAVVEPGLLPNGLPPGKTMGADGKIVDAADASF
jgi:hypothetical protein